MFQRRSKFQVAITLSVNKSRYARCQARCVFASLIFRVSLCGKFANFFRGLQRIDQDRGDCRFLYPVCFLGVKFLAASVGRGRLQARARAGYANAITNSRSLCGERKKEERFAEKMELGIFIPPLIRYSRRTAAVVSVSKVRSPPDVEL